MPCFFMHAALALPLPFLGSYSPHFSIQQPACYSWPGAPVLTDALPSLLLSGDVCIVRAPFDVWWCILSADPSPLGLPGAWVGQRLWGSYKRGSVLNDPVVCEDDTPQNKKSHIVLPTSVQGYMCGLKLYAVWGWRKTGPLVNILRIWNVCVGAPCVHL